MAETFAETVDTGEASYRRADTARKELLRYERRTTPQGPERVRVGYRIAVGKPRQYYEQEERKAWHVTEAQVCAPGTYTFTVCIESANRDGELLTQIHIFDEGTDPVVIIDRQNFYGEWIDARRMPLVNYLRMKRRETS